MKEDAPHWYDWPVFCPRPAKYYEVEPVRHKCFRQRHQHTNIDKLQPCDRYLGHLSCVPSLEASIIGTNKDFVGIPHNNVISHVSFCSNLKSDKYWDKGAVSVWKRSWGPCWLPVFRDDGVLEALGLPSPLFRFSMRNPWSWWHFMASDASQTVNQTLVGSWLHNLDISIGKQKLSTGSMILLSQKITLQRGILHQNNAGQVCC